MGRGIRRTSKTKVVVARSTRVHIRLIIRRVYLGEYGIVGVHIGVHGIIKVNRFIICGVMSHCTTGGLDKKRGGGRRERIKGRNTRSTMRVVRLMGWIRGYIVTSKERIIMSLRGDRRRATSIRTLIRVRVRV